MLDEVERVLPLIASRPDSFPRLLDIDENLEVRRALLQRFPYGVVFLPRVPESPSQKFRTTR